MKIRLQFLPEHPDRVQHTVLPVDVIMLNDGVEERVLSGNAYLARVDFYVVDVPFVHAFHCRFEIDDLSLAHAARWRLTHTEDLDGAVGTAFANNDTDLRRANLKTDHQII